jgi:hypothetical protein
MPFLALFRRNPRSNGYGPLSINSTLDDDYDDSLLLNGALTDDSNQSHVTNGFASGARNDSGSRCSGRCECCKNVTCSPRNILDFLLTNLAISVIAIVIGVAIPTGLGLWALCVLDPPMVIDKSMNSFTIPNHQATKRADALSVAISHINIGSNWRGKRSVDNIVNEGLFFDQSKLPEYTGFRNDLKSFKNTLGRNKLRSTSLQNDNNIPLSNMTDRRPNYVKIQPTKNHLRNPNNAMKKTKTKSNFLRASKSKLSLLSKSKMFHLPGEKLEDHVEDYGDEVDSVEGIPHMPGKFSVRREKRSLPRKKRNGGLNYVYT